MKNFYTCFSFLILISVSLKAQTRFEAREVAQSLSSPSGLFAGDIDSDGDTDILCASGEFGVYILRNLDGQGNSWGRSRIDNSMGATLTVWMADIDNDGFNDILTGGWVSSEVIWYRNTGNSSTWEKKVIQSSFANPHEIRTKDIDGDGNLDVICAGAGSNQIVIWYNQNGDGTYWQKQIVDNNFMGARSVDVSDIDQDGDPDLAGASLDGNEVTIWRNDGGVPITWTEVTLANDFAGSHRIQLVDMNHDGLIDVLGTAYGARSISWWKNSGNIANDWEKFVVEDDLIGAVIGSAVDFDQDGDMDVVGTGQDGNTVNYYERTEAGENTWRKKVLDDGFGGAWPMAVGDFDGDSNIDFAIGGNSNNVVSFFKNIQEGRFTRIMDLRLGSTRAGVFIPPDMNSEMPLYLVLPYCGDEYAFSRLRDVLIPLAEERPGIVLVPEIENMGGPDYLLEEPEILSSIISYAVVRFDAMPDSVYLMGMECNGSPVLQFGQTNPSDILGIIPFNVLKPEYVLDTYNSYPDIPVCLCSGTNHSDRLNHQAIVSDINNTYGKAWLNDLEGAGDEVLIGTMVEQLLNCLNFIDTVKGGTSSIYQTPNSLDFNLFPNPAQSEINVQMSNNNKPVTITIMDAMGREIWSDRVFSNRQPLPVLLNQSAFSSGLFFLRVQGTEKSITKRFIIRR